MRQAPQPIRQALPPSAYPHQIQPAMQWIYAGQTQLPQFGEQLKGRPPRSDIPPGDCVSLRAQSAVEQLSDSPYFEDGWKRRDSTVEKSGVPPSSRSSTETTYRLTWPWKQSVSSNEQRKSATSNWGAWRSRLGTASSRCPTMDFHTCDHLNLETQPSCVIQRVGLPFGRVYASSLRHVNSTARNLYKKHRRLNVKSVMDGFPTQYRIPKEENTTELLSTLTDVDHRLNVPNPRRHEALGR
jgi:hypothetical protein